LLLILTLCFTCFFIWPVLETCVLLVVALLHSSYIRTPTCVVGQQGVDQYRLQWSMDYDARYDHHAELFTYFLTVYCTNAPSSFLCALVRDHHGQHSYPGTWHDCTTLKGVVMAPLTELIVSELKSVHPYFFRLAVRNEIDGCWSTWSKPSEMWRSERRW
jgi:hypothetical protein